MVPCHGGTTSVSSADYFTASQSCGGKVGPPLRRRPMGQRRSAGPTGLRHRVTEAVQRAGSADWLRRAREEGRIVRFDGDGPAWRLDWTHFGRYPPRPAGTPPKEGTWRNALPRSRSSPGRGPRSGGWVSQSYIIRRSTPRPSAFPHRRAKRCWFPGRAP